MQGVGILEISDTNGHYKTSLNQRDVQFFQHLTSKPHIREQR